MDKDKERGRLAEAFAVVKQCDRCGTCLPACPLFGVKDVEAVSARGKNNIARALAEGGLEAGGDVLRAVNFCLLCRACTDICPSKLKTDIAMMAVRQHLAEKSGAGVKYKALGGMLKARNLVKLSAGLLGLARKTGLNRLVPFGMAPSQATRAEYLAAFAGPAVLGGQAPAAAAPALAGGGKVAYFQGCGMRMMFPDAVRETLAILATTGEVMEADNECCGLPHLAHGLRDDFLALARENVRLFAAADVIVSDCASCSGTLKHIAEYLADDPAWKEQAAAFSAKVMSLSEYLAKVGYKPRQRAAVRLTFHEPCHLGRGQGVKKQPRELLKAAGDYVEMAGADVCCGGAGSFHIDYPDAAAAVLAKKQAAIGKTGAQVVVTECPVCLVQLTKSAAAGGGKFKALHISQVL